jgi:hypothetical protein
MLPFLLIVLLMLLLSAFTPLEKSKSTSKTKR